MDGQQAGGRDGRYELFHGGDSRRTKPVVVVAGQWRRRRRRRRVRRDVCGSGRRVKVNAIDGDRGGDGFLAENESVLGYRGTGGRAVRGDDCATANLENRATMAPEVRFPTRRAAAVIESPRAQRPDDYPTSRRARQRTVSRGVNIVRSVTGYRGRVSGLFDFPSSRVFGTGGASSKENRCDQSANDGIVVTCRPPGPAFVSYFVFIVVCRGRFRPISIVERRPTVRRVPLSKNKIQIKVTTLSTP